MLGLQEFILKNNLIFNNLLLNYLFGQAVGLYGILKTDEALNVGFFGGQSGRIFSKY
jgi:hypothetical protein